MTTDDFPINEMKKSLMKIEKKLDFLTHQLNKLNIERLTRALIASIHVEPSNSRKRFQTEPLEKEVHYIASILTQKFDTHFLQFESLLSIYNSLPNIKLLPATRGWAGSPDFLAKVAEIILKEKPRFVLEAGSGVSSIIIGLALKLNNYGKAVSLDHDELYAKATIEYIGVNEIVDISKVTHCPLREYDILEQPCKWYESESLNLSERIDMLIIDGPPRYTNFLARYPAVPLLHTYFSDHVLILLDDANRNDEVITIQKWVEFLECNNFKVTVTRFSKFEKGMALLDVHRIA